MAAPASAENASLSIGQDRYEVGDSLEFEGPAVDDLFMAGNRVALKAPVAGSAYVAGRRVAGDLFAAGYGVLVGRQDRVRAGSKHRRHTDDLCGQPGKLRCARISGTGGTGQYRSAEKI